MSTNDTAGHQIELPIIKLSLPTIVLLDAIRSFAALYVVLHHLAQTLGVSSVLGFPLRFGQEAVIVFFLLSGFVIFANEKERSRDAFSYLSRRARRVYPTLLAAMLFSALVAYADNTFAERFQWRQFWLTILNVQDVSALKPGVISDPFLGNTPLWSLSYEAFFYLIFPAIMVAWRRNENATDHAIGALACLSYIWYAYCPNHWALVASYFLIWWTGAMLAQSYALGGRNLRTIAVPLVWLALLTITGVGVLIANRQLYTSVGVYPFLQVRHFASALLIVVLGFGPLGVALGQSIVGWRKTFQFTASISFGLYVFHYPLLVTSGAAETLTGLLAGTTAVILLSLTFDRGSTIFLKKLLRNRSS